MEPSNDCRRVHDGMEQAGFFRVGSTMFRIRSSSDMSRMVSRFSTVCCNPNVLSNFAGRDLEAFQAACVFSQCRQQLGKLSKLVARTYMAERLSKKHMQRVTIGRKDGYLLWTYKPANDDDTRLAFELRKQLRSNVDAVLPGL